VKRLPWIVAGLLIGAGALGLLIARHVMPSGPPAAAAPAALTSGDGVVVKVSDKPVPLPSMSLRDLDGTAIDPARWRGKVVILNFWATWCGPCRDEIPVLMALQEHYRDSLQVIGLSIDTGSPAKVRQYTQAVGVNYPIAIADQALQDAFGGVPAVPSTFVVRPDAGIIQKHVGLVDPRVLEHEVRSLAGLPTTATVEVVQDTGQVLLANAAYATEIPGLDMSKCTPEQREALLKQLNTDKCSCPCGFTLAQCRINDPSCQYSLPLARKLLERIAR
jgi:thiol-disulfide isomerase/thioredoxin